MLTKVLCETAPLGLIAPYSALSSSWIPFSSDTCLSQADRWSSFGNFACKLLPQPGTRCMPA